MKPKINFADLAWMQAFESVKKNGVSGDFKILHVNDDPPWVQVKSSAGKRMIRKDDPMIHALLKQ